MVGKQQHGGVERRKEKNIRPETRSRAAPRRQRTAYFRKTRARGRGIDTNTGPDAAATA